MQTLGVVEETDTVRPDEAVGEIDRVSPTPASEIAANVIVCGFLLTVTLRVTVGAAASRSTRSGH